MFAKFIEENFVYTLFVLEKAFKIYKKKGTIADLMYHVQMHSNNFHSFSVIVQIVIFQFTEPYLFK